MEGGLGVYILLQHAVQFHKYTRVSLWRWYGYDTTEQSSSGGQQL
jgi:hypothetical protein